MEQSAELPPPTKSSRRDLLKRTASLVPETKPFLKEANINPIFGCEVTPIDADNLRADEVISVSRRRFLKDAAAAAVGAVAGTSGALKVIDKLTNIPKSAAKPSVPAPTPTPTPKPLPASTPEAPAAKTPIPPSQVTERVPSQPPIATETAATSAVAEKEKKIDPALLTNGKLFGITQEFGQTDFFKANRNLYAGNQHNGVDIGLPSGTALTAPIEGEVVTAELHQGQGNRVIVKTKWGYLLLAHLRKIDVKNGQAVKPGDVLGYSGGGINDPGKGVSTGAHLHLEVWDEQKQPFDPLEIFSFPRPGLGDSNP